MNVTVDDLIARYGAEVDRLTQRAVLAEAREYHERGGDQGALIEAVTSQGTEES